MAYRKGQAGQQMMFPPSYEEMVGKEEPVRLYSDFVDQLEVESLGLKINNHKEGNPEYDPRAMLKLLLYGYSYGIRSSRRLERAVNHNINFIWLVGGLKPDHKTICLFRKRNKRVLKQIFRKCVELCIKLEVVKGNTLYVDGSKFRANAGIKNNFTKHEAKERVAELNRKIARMLNECDRVDRAEAEQGSWLKLPEQIDTAEKRRKAIEEAMADIDEMERSVNLTDPDAKLMRGRQGSHSGYNAQVVVDDENGLVVSADVVNDGNDNRQLAEQIDNACRELSDPPEAVVADKGYFNPSQIEEVSEKGMRVIIPPIKYARSRKQLEAFAQTQFRYDAQNDTYRCPKGHELGRFSQSKTGAKYRIKSAKTCLECPHFGTCTTSKRGRTLVRSKHQEVLDTLYADYAAPEGQQLYRKRGYKVEPVFGHFKHNLKAGSFLLRGLSGVKAEMALLATTYNLRRLMTIFGFHTLKHQLSPV